MCKTRERERKNESKNIFSTPTLLKNLRVLVSVVSVVHAVEADSHSLHTDPSAVDETWPTVGALVVEHNPHVAALPSMN